MSRGRLRIPARGPARWHIREQLSPLLQRTVAGHDGGTVLIAPHHHFQQVFPLLLGQRLQAHVVDDDKVRPEIAAQGPVLLLEGLVFEEVPHEVEDRSIEHLLALFDGLISQRLSQMGLAHSRGAQEQDVLALAEVAPGGQLIDLLAADRGVELPIEVLKRFEGPEVCGFGSPLQVALLPDIEFILEDQLQELLMA